MVSPWVSQRHSTDSVSPLITSDPTPSPAVTPAPLSNLDPLLTRPLNKVEETGGAIARFDGAFPAVNIKDVLLLPGLTEDSVPWLAVSIVGIVNQLQIVDPKSSDPSHVVTVPSSHSGGIGTMVWHQRSKTLYLTTSNSIMAWSPSNAEVIRTVIEVPGATGLYDLQVDASGNLWGGTYPNGAAFSYTIATKMVKVHSRLAPDTDYVRQVAIGPDDKVWLGTGSRNPRLFTFDVARPEKITEIPLPDPIPSGFVTEIAVISDRVVVMATDVDSEMLLDPATKKWAGKIARVWSSRRASQAARGSSTFYTVTGGALYATDTKTWKDSKLGVITADLPLAIHATSTSVVVVGQVPTGLRLEYFSLSSSSVEMTHSIKLHDSEFAVHSLMGHSDGNIYIGAYMGDGLASINPRTGARWRSPDKPGLVNQIEGMIEFDAKRSYIGSYGSAEIISVDSQSKDNPRGYVRLERLSQKYHQSRPFGWAANSRQVFFGTVPDYGRAGGVLGMINPRSDKISWVLDGGGEGFVKAHSIIGLAANDRFVYGTTSVRNGYGLPDTKGPARVFKLEIATKKKVWESSPVASAGALYAPILMAGWLLVADLEGVHVINPSTGKLIRTHRLTPAKNSSRRPGWINADLVQVGNGSKIVHTAGGTTTVVDFRAGTMAVVGSPKSKIQFGNRLASTALGRVYSSADKTALIELDLGRDS